MPDLDKTTIALDVLDVTDKAYDRGFAAGVQAARDKIEEAPGFEYTKEFGLCRFRKGYLIRRGALLSSLPVNADSILPPQGSEVVLLSEHEAALAAEQEWAEAVEKQLADLQAQIKAKAEVADGLAADALTVDARFFNSRYAEVFRSLLLEDGEG